MPLGTAGQTACYYEEYYETVKHLFPQFEHAAAARVDRGNPFPVSALSFDDVEACMGGLDVYTKHRSVLGVIDAESNDQRHKHYLQQRIRELDSLVIFAHATAVWPAVQSHCCGSSHFPNSKDGWAPSPRK